MEQKIDIKINTSQIEEDIKTLKKLTNSFSGINKVVTEIGDIGSKSQGLKEASNLLKNSSNFISRTQVMDIQAFAKASGSLVSVLNKISQATSGIDNSRLSTFNRTLAQTRLLADSLKGKSFEKNASYLGSVISVVGKQASKTTPEQSIAFAKTLQQSSNLTNTLRGESISSNAFSLNTIYNTLGTQIAKSDKEKATLFSKLLRTPSPQREPSPQNQRTSTLASAIPAVVSILGSAVVLGRIKQIVTSTTELANITSTISSNVGINRAGVESLGGSASGVASEMLGQRREFYLKGIFGGFDPEKLTAMSALGINYKSSFQQILSSYRQAVNRLGPEIADALASKSLGSETVSLLQRQNTALKYATPQGRQDIFRYLEYKGKFADEGTMVRAQTSFNQTTAVMNDFIRGLSVDTVKEITTFSDKLRNTIESSSGGGVRRSSEALGSFTRGLTTVMGVAVDGVSKISSGFSALDNLIGKDITNSVTSMAGSAVGLLAGMKAVSTTFNTLDKIIPGSSVVGGIANRILIAGVATSGAIELMKTFFPKEAEAAEQGKNPGLTKKYFSDMTSRERLVATLAGGANAIAGATAGVATTLLGGPLALGIGVGTGAYVTSQLNEAGITEQLVSNILTALGYKGGDSSQNMEYQQINAKNSSEMVRYLNQIANNTSPRSFYNNTNIIQ